MFNYPKTIATEIGIISCEDNPNMKKKLNAVNRAATDYL